ncbi:similar to Saccharomyces cerevisiae YIL047C SYG1 Plasma membrane protein of unknown function [Maudiozyma saulgeensis]|uniref:SPX domain-containing protein n=1 Tax=Maudiozyma saulgeensis TaxID=1789683 RepID=A0A1X7QY40_9SACH|nr:similar to Saccharomyces cerevisiae YIL047C SYG1 Plasma membrane protein of unknown function [Kazachstania saulgeensis]
MKFADQLSESVIPEWKDKYIDYKIGKKRLKYHYGKLPKDPFLARLNEEQHIVDNNNNLSTISRENSGLELNTRNDIENESHDENDLDAMSIESTRSISAASHLAKLRKNNYNSRSNDSFNSLMRSSSTPMIPNLVTGNPRDGGNNSRSGSSGGGSGGSRKGNKRRNRNNRNKNGNKNTSFKKEKIIYSRLQKTAVKDFIEDWLIAIELTKCNDFYIWLLDECGTKFGVLKTQMHMYKLQKEKIIDPTSDETQSLKLSSIDNVSTYGSTSPQFQEGDNQSETDIDATVVAAGMTANDSLMGKSKKQSPGLRSNIKYFLKQKNLLPSWPKNAFKHKILEEKELSRSASGMSLASLNNGSDDDRNSNIRYGSPTLSAILNPAKETFAYDLSLVSDEMTLPRAQRLLNEAILEFYLFLQLVKAYRDLNVTGFRKIVKKFDKTLGTNELPRFMKYARDNYSLFKHVNNNVKLMAQHMKRTSSYHILTDLVPNSPKDDPLLWWETRARTWYCTDLTNSPHDMKKKRDKLKKLNIEYTLNESMIHRNNRSTLQMTTAGLFLGFSFSIFLYTLYLSFSSPAVSYTRKILFPLWGGWYMTLLMLILFQVNCFIWHRAGINYKFIMFGEVKTRSGTQMYNNDFATTGISLKLYYVSFYVLLTCICAGLSFKLQELSPWSFVAMASVFILFFMPSNFVPYWDKVVHTRNWLIITSIRLACSGIFPVEFGDFFLGDIVCSLTYSIADIAMFACIYSTNEQGLCGSSHSKSMGVLSSIPSYWRLLQCIRRFLDSGDWFPHLINAIKYSFGVGYQATLCAYRLDPFNEQRRTYFIIVSTMNSVLTSIWDLIIDWSLFQPSYRNLFLRDDLYLAGKRNWEDGSYSPKRKALYYSAMVWDVVIRFQWVVYAVAPQSIQQSAKTSFVLALTELLRRFVWVIFRIENEHVANVHLFRVTGDSPLPYPVLPSSDTNNIVQQARKTRYLLHRQSSEDSEPVIQSSSTAHPLSNVNQNIRRPSTAYHTLTRRNTTMFGKISDSIPWVHATDFQRPVATPLNDPSDLQLENDEHSPFDSDTESESGI